MHKISSVEFQRHIGNYQDKALAAPIIITRNGRERLVLLSVEEYRRLLGRAAQDDRRGEPPLQCRPAQVDFDMRR